MSKTRVTTAQEFEEEISHLDESVKAVSAHTLFEQLDTTGDGQLNEEEFKKMYEVMKGHIKKEHIHEQEEKARLAASKRRTKFAVIAAAILSVFLGLSIAANAGATYALIEATKEVHVTPGATSSLTDPSGNPVSTSENLVDVKLMVLPALKVAEIAKVRYLNFHYTESPTRRRTRP